MDPRTGMGRLVRIAAFAVAALILSVVAHVSAGGSAPGTSALLIAVVPVVLVAVHLSGRRRGTASLVAALGGLQIALHTVFHTLGQARALSPEPAHRPPPTGHAAHGLDLSGAAPLGPAEHLAHGGASPLMVAAHALAVLALAWLMARGEDALWRVVAAFFVVLLGVVRLDRTPRPPTPRPLALPAGRDVFAVGVRGPPRAVCA